MNWAVVVCGLFWHVLLAGVRGGFRAGMLVSVGMGRGTRLRTSRRSGFCGSRSLGVVESRRLVGSRHPRVLEAGGHGVWASLSLMLLQVMTLIVLDRSLGVLGPCMLAALASVTARLGSWRLRV